MNDSNGTLRTDAQSISQEFIDYYEGLLGTSEQNLASVHPEVLWRGNTVNEEQRKELCKPVSEEEVKRAVWSIESSKSPGPGGFTSDFYKKSWHIIKKELCDAVKDFVEKGKLLKQTNATLITLVPKSVCPATVADYKPIACCNVIYKIITKIITFSARLIRVLSRNAR